MTTPPRPTIDERIITILRQKGVLRPRDLDEYNLPRRYASRLASSGKLERVARGLYRLPGAVPPSHFTAALVAKRLPNAVICLLSALQMHELTAQLPHEVWVAIDRNARLPRAHDLPVRIVRFGGRALTEGIEERNLAGVPVKVYSAAKTVADCFKYRNKVGLDVALEALTDCRRQRKASIEELVEAATICRVSRIMRPYLEVIG